ncbi:MAG: hypothetical protein IID41_14035, partial [Planctomycetes bacterium]|nr:hypothetical protein [Planctomycetota bacterium]
MSQPDDKVHFITFYSYKGGVGRTMALANVACQLANLHGKHVICVDWDLEAPGLHYYFKFTDEELVTRAGLLDYLLDFKWQYEQGAKGKEPNIRNYLLELKPKQRDKIKHGSVRLLHCGQTGPNYMARVQAFDWDEYYEKCEGFRIIETLKKQLLDCKADLILVDARAGQADVGATPTIQVPDAVVLLFTSNTQNLEGTAKIARDLSQHRMRKQLKKALKLLMVPARVFPREESFQRWLDEHAVPTFDKLVAEDVVSLRDQPKGLAQCMIPIDAKWAVPERLPILEAST